MRRNRSVSLTSTYVPTYSTDIPATTIDASTATISGTASNDVTGTVLYKSIDPNKNGNTIQSAEMILNSVLTDKITGASAAPFSTNTYTPKTDTFPLESDVSRSGLDLSFDLEHNMVGSHVVLMDDNVVSDTA